MVEVSLILPDGSAPGPILVTLMAESIARLCRDIPLRMDVAAAGNELFVYDPLHDQQAHKAEIRSYLRENEDYWISRLVWFSFYREVDGP